MPAARARPLDDSRSETSSIITNLKDRSVLGPSGVSAISKGKRIASSNYNGSSSLSKPVLNGTPGIPPESDPNLPRTNWQTLSTPLLHTYAQSHHLPSTSVYTHPHADIIYKSSSTAMRTPSMVQTRRKLRDLKSQRLKAVSQNGTKKEKTLQRERERERERERSSDRLKQLLQPTDSLALDHLPSTSTTPPIGKQTHNALALAVRRHFNSQQVSEPDAIAKFLYVVHHGAGANPDPAADTASQDHGTGTGSQGRQASKGLGVWGADGGGDLGFRLRFRPDIR